MISDGEQSRRLLFNSGVIKRIIELLAHENLSLKAATIRTIGNLLTGNDQDIDMMINAGVLDKLAMNLNIKKRSIKKELLWSISNLAVGTMAQADAVLTHPCLRAIIGVLEDPDFEIMKEAIYIIANGSFCGSPEVLNDLIDQGILEILCRLLDFKDSRILMLVLEAISNFLKAGRTHQILQNLTSDKVGINFDEAGGIAKLESLQDHPNINVYNKVTEILSKFFDAEEVNPEESSKIAKFNFS